VDSSPIRGSVNVVTLTKLFCATIEYRYKINDLSGRDVDVLNAFLDRVGINLNPSIVWNAIPWTFVLDWVMDVSTWLDQFKVRNIEPQTAISQYCYSWKINRCINAGTHKGAAFSVNEYAYKRVPYNPDITRSITTSGLNLREFSLLGALGITRTH